MSSESPSYVNGNRINRGHSSGFSSGSGSNSSGTTPPPLGSSSAHQMSLCDVITVHQPLDNEDTMHISDESILDVPELETAPWFQPGIPR